MKTRNIFMAILAGSLTAPQQASAEDLRGVWFTGGSLAEGQSVYGGAVIALPGNRLGSGLAVRGSASAGNYEYIADGQEIKGDYVGGELALVYQTSGHWGWANFSVGPRITDTNLTPTDPDNARQGTGIDVGLQTDGALDGASWRGDWQLAYALDDQAYQAQLRLARKLGDGSFRLGVEGGVLGDPSFSRSNAGLHAAFPMVGRSEVQIGAGLTFQERRNGGIYGSVGISSVF